MTPADYAIEYGWIVGLIAADGLYAPDTAAEARARAQNSAHALDISEAVVFGLSLT